MVVNRREGGMGVIDIKQFWAVLKVGWFKRALISNDFWVDYLRLMLTEKGVHNISDLMKMGDIALRNLSESLEHPFWKDALNALADVKLGYHLSHQERLLQSPIFHTEIVLRVAGRNDTCFKPQELPDLSEFASTFQD